MDRRKGTLLLAAAVGTAMVGSVIGESGVASANYDCNTTGRMCLSSGTGGSGYIHDFAVDDGSLVGNTYSNGSVVGDNNLSVRDRNASSTRACVYVDQNYLGGTTGYANYSGAGWVTIAAGGSSIRFRFSASC